MSPSITSATLPTLLTFKTPIRRSRYIESDQISSGICTKIWSLFEAGEGFEDVEQRRLLRREFVPPEFSEGDEKGLGFADLGRVDEKPERGQRTRRVRGNHVCCEIPKKTTCLPRELSRGNHVVGKRTWPKDVLPCVSRVKVKYRIGFRSARERSREHDTRKSERVRATDDEIKKA